MTARVSSIVFAAALSLSLCGRAQAACDEPDTGIRLNQLGFYVGAAKRAVIATPSAKPVGWELLDSSGEVRARGRAEIFGDDPVSGDRVQLADFTEFRDTGLDFRIRSGCAASHPFAIGDKPYGRLKYDALSYFYQSRSGIPIEAKYAGGEKWARPAGHPHDIATCRADVDPHGNRWPGCDYSLDVTGGWYDAGDQGKYVVNGGIAVWTLLDFYERGQAAVRKEEDSKETFADGSGRIPESGNGVNDLLDEARYEMEFLLRMQAPDGAKARVPVGIERNRENVPFTAIDASGMAHHKIGDVRWTPLPTPPQLDPEKRVLAPVSTAATLNLAATAAQCARIWREIDDSFSARCLDAARRAYAAAKRNPQVYFIADFSGSGPYGDGDLDDEFFWAAAELYVSTGDTVYGTAVRQSPYFSEPVPGAPNWYHVAPLGLISLALVPNDLETDEVRALRQRIVDIAERFSAEREQSGYHIPYAGSGYPWGSNSVILNRAILLGLAYDFTGDDAYRNAVIDAIDYILGRNPLDQSYVTGYGERPVRHPHHRFWAPSLDPTLPPPPPGVMAAGPNSMTPAEAVAKSLIDAGCAPQTCWRDDINAFSLNEVAINWNAPLVWVAAFVDEPPR